MAELLRFEVRKFGADPHLGFQGRCISVIAQILQTYNAACRRQSSAKSSNPRLSYSDLTIENLWRTATLDFKVSVLQSLRDSSGPKRTHIPNLSKIEQSEAEL